MALAKGARDNGAEINRNTDVTAIERKPNGEWQVSTNRGEITAEHVVAASGNYARQTAAMVGLDIPVIPVEHQYLVTDEIAELVERKAQGLPEMAVLRESDASYYMREERQGLILGPYEKGAPAWAVDGGARGLRPGAAAARHRPAGPAHRGRDQAGAGVRPGRHQGLRKTARSPIRRTATPSSAPPTGFATSGSRRAFPSASRRPAARASTWPSGSSRGKPASTCCRSTRGASGPTPTRPTPRPRTRRPTRMSSPSTTPTRSARRRGPRRPARATGGWMRRARFGASATAGSGPTGFAPEGMERKDDWSFRRTNYFEPVGSEARAARQRAGLIDITSFSKFEISGPGAEGYLDRLVANRLPGKIGRMSALPCAHEDRRGPERVHHHPAGRGALLRRELGCRGAPRSRFPGQGRAR